MTDNDNYAKQLEFIEEMARRFRPIHDAFLDRKQEFEEDALDPPVHTILADTASWIDRNVETDPAGVSEILSAFDYAYSRNDLTIRALIGMGLVESLPRTWSERGQKVWELAGQNIKKLIDVCSKNGVVFEKDLD
ncbi:hypothetical protein ACLQ3C_21155 [Gordonia sp. DT30]|uniref:hypothetical protein n=1 Tax=Gordonia sp. DT30 TaxID=3416546 RepID=UPI003CF3BEA1